MSTIGACDVCNAQRVEVSFSIVCGIETYACSEGCDTPQQLITCEACDGSGVEVFGITVYEPGCGFSHPSTDERPCGHCAGLGEFIADAQADQLERV